MTKTKEAPALETEAAPVKEAPVLEAGAALNDPGVASAQVAPPMPWRELRYLEEQITMLNHDGPRDGLCEELRLHHGALIEADPLGEVWQVTVYGLEGEPSNTLRVALENWANAARRHLLTRTAGTSDGASA